MPAGHKIILQDRVCLEIFKRRESGHFLEGGVQVGLIVKDLGIDMLDDARNLRIKRRLYKSTFWMLHNSFLLIPKVDLYNLRL